jgi:prophage DNA circulation protein
MALPNGWDAPSIRGVPFHLKSHDRSGGRRGPDHEFAARDLPDAEDTGAAVETFTIAGFVTATSVAAFEATRAALIEALRAPGAAWYRGPHGAMRVMVRSWTTAENEDQLGRCDFTMTLAEAGDARFPEAGADGAALMRSAADRLSLAAAEAFNARFRVSSLPQTVAETAAARFTSWGDAALDSALGLPRLGIAAGAAAIREARTALGLDLVARLYEDAAAPVMEFTDALASAAYAVDRAGRSSGAPLRAAALFGGLVDRASDVAETIGGVAASVVAVNEAAQDLFVRRLSLAHEARALAAGGFETAGEVRSARTAFVARADRVRLAAASTGLFDDAAFSAVTTLSQRVSADLATRAGGLPNAVTIESGGAPSILLAHRLYGDATREAEILKRNPSMVRPLFASSRIEALDG